MERKGYGPEPQGREARISAAKKDITNYIKGAPAGSGRRMAFIDQVELLKAERQAQESGMLGTRAERKIDSIEMMIIDRKGTVEGYPEAYDDLEEKIDNLREAIRPLYPLVSTSGAEDHLVKELKEIGKDAREERADVPEATSILNEPGKEKKIKTKIILDAERIIQKLDADPEDYYVDEDGMAHSSKEYEAVVKIDKALRRLDPEITEQIIENTLTKINSDNFNPHQGGKKFKDDAIMLASERPDFAEKVMKRFEELEDFEKAADIASFFISTHPDIAEEALARMLDKSGVRLLAVNLASRRPDLAEQRLKIVLENGVADGSLAEKIASNNPALSEKAMRQLSYATYAEVYDIGKIAAALAPYKPEVSIEVLSKMNEYNELSGEVRVAVALAPHRPDESRKAMDRIAGIIDRGKEGWGYRAASEIAVALAGYRPEAVRGLMKKIEAGKSLEEEGAKIAVALGDISAAKRFLKKAEDRGVSTAVDIGFLLGDTGPAERMLKKEKSSYSIRGIAIQLIPHKPEVAVKAMEDLAEKGHYSDVVAVAKALAPHDSKAAERMMQKLEEKGKYVDAADIVVKFLEMMREDTFPSETQAQKAGNNIDKVVSAKPLDVEWNHLSQLSQRLARDLDVLKLHSDTVGYGMEPYERLHETLESAQTLLNVNPSSNLARRAADELKYLRQGLDKHREWMEREANRRNRKFENDQRAAEREQDRRETQAYRNTMGSKGRPSESAAAREAREFTKWSRKDTYRLRKPGGWD